MAQAFPPEVGLLLGQVQRSLVRMKLIHLSDIRLDRSFVGASLPPEICNACRDGLRATLEQVLQHAVSVHADAVLVAGNLLDGARYLPTTLRWLKERLEDLGDIPVLIAAGDMDPLSSGSPYTRGLWPDNVHFFKDAWSVFTVPDTPLAIAGCARSGVETGLPVFPESLWKEPSTYRVALAPVAPAPEARHGLKPLMHPALAQAHYLALGGSSPSCQIVEAAPAHVGYPAMLPAAHAVALQQAHFLEVSLSAASDADTAVAITPQELDATQFLIQQVRCEEAQSAEGLLQRLETCISELAVNPDRLVLRLVLGGTLSMKVRGVLPEIQEQLAEHLLYVELLDETQPQDFFDAYAQSATTLGRFLQRVGLEIEDAPDYRRWRVLCRAREAGWVAFHQELPFPARGVEEDVL